MSSFTEIPGGVTAPAGFLAGSIFCGIKPANTSRPDLAIIYSPTPAVVAGTFTTNKVRAAPVRVSAAHLRAQDVRAIVVNAGNANACTGADGIENAKRMTRTAGRALGLQERQVMVCSTGRIGVPLPIDKIEQSIHELAKELTPDGSRRAAEAIMTSDSFHKEIAVECQLAGKRVRVGGIAKGAGMIDPNMATMLCFLTTDAMVRKPELQQALSISVEQSFNRITVDGDMSTNDTVLLLANGEAGHLPLENGTKEMECFQEALDHVTKNLARMIVEDGEGVTRFVEVHVNGAGSYSDARRAAEAIAKSTLVKCAWFGGDPNWGRIMDAIGYSGARLREETVDIFYDGVIAVRGGMASMTPFQRLQEICAQKRFTVTVALNLGAHDYTVYTTDLSTEYVELNMGE